jgi:hypothetical protein
LLLYVKLCHHHHFSYLHPLPPTQSTQHNIRDRSLFIVQGGIEEKLGGPLNFLKPERGGFEKIERDERRRALKIFTSLKKH